MAGGPMLSKGGKEYPGKLTAKVFWTCILAATGGLIFGYDLGISGGVTSMSTFLKRFFPHVYSRQLSNVPGTDSYCKFDDAILTLFTSSLYLAALAACMVASVITRKVGRRVSMVLGGLLFLAGAILNLFAMNVLMLIGGRILLGFGIGFANQSVPVYLSEMAPYKYRGALNMMFQLSITIGILAANFINFGVTKLNTDKDWRISLGLAAVPGLFFLLGSLFLSDTPNSLIERGRESEALKMLRTIRGVDDVKEEFDDLVAASKASKEVEHPWRNIVKRKYRPQLVLVTLIPMFQQLTGINVFMFYAPVLFKTIGFGTNASLFSSAITGGINFVATFVSIMMVDKFGRRGLFLEGGIQIFICQIIITLAIGLKFGVSGDPGELSKGYAMVLVIAICVLVAGFAWSWGPLGWLVPSEILPLEIRSAGQSINVSVNMIFTFVIAEMFLKGLCVMKFGLFIFFAVLVFVMTVFIYFYLPETKGVPIEEMGRVWRTHPTWKKYVEEEGGDRRNNNAVEEV